MVTSVSFNSGTLISLNSPRSTEKSESPGSQQLLDTDKNAFSDVSVTLSEWAKKRFQETGKMAEALQRLEQDALDARKELARARLEEIKREIARLKALLMMSDGASVKGILRQLKQLASQIQGLAAVLGASGADGGSSGQASVGTASPVATEGAQAETASLSAVSGLEEASGHDVPSKEADASRSPDNASLTGSAVIDVRGQAASAERQQEARQKREDARSLQETVQALKSLLEAIKKKLQETAKQDRQTAQDVTSVENRIQEAEQAFQSMAGSSLETGIGLAAAAAPLA